MCGRYYRRGSKQQIAEAMRAQRVEPSMPEVLASYNIAPTTHQPVVRHSRDGAVRELLLMRWGLLPFFAKRAEDFRGYSTFNARADNVPTGNTWREPFAEGRRCLVPADGFYEWEVLEPGNKKSPKQPYAFTVNHQPTMAFAGLWDEWRDKRSDAWLLSFSIITTNRTS